LIVLNETINKGTKSNHQYALWNSGELKIRKINSRKAHNLT